MLTTPQAVHTRRDMATLPVLSSSPVGDTKMPEPIIVPTIREIPLNSPTVLLRLMLASLLDLSLLLLIVLSSDSKY